MAPIGGLWLALALGSGLAAASGPPPTAAGAPPDFAPAAGRPPGDCVACGGGAGGLVTYSVTAGEPAGLRDSRTGVEYRT